jgi:heterodisulfide reductase subunit A
MRPSQPRIGVYVCRCGINIAASVDVDAATAYAAGLPGVAAAHSYLYMCSEPGQDLIRQDLESGLVNRVVVASCTPRMHEPTFRGVCLEKGLNPYFFEQANIREQCAWIHPPGEPATAKAKDLIRAAVRRVALHEPLEERNVEVLGRSVVIGGGAAGMSAALAVAEAGFPVLLVEKAPRLGGHAAAWHRAFPSLACVDDLIGPLAERVRSHPHIRVLLESEVSRLDGYIGNFKVEVQHGGDRENHPAGTVIVAIGFDPFNPQQLPELGYGRLDGVVSSADLEQLLRERPDTLAGVRDVIFVSCVGSRDRQVGNPYCSRICCMVNMKQALLLREQLPGARITVLYIDVRAFGKGYEELYDRVRGQGVLYRRGHAAEVRSQDGRLLVQAEDTLLGRPIALAADLVVLGTGMVPRPDHGDLSALLKLPRSEDGFFMEKHPKLGPVETTVDGIFLAGACQAPKDITDAVSHARAAAAAALAPMMRRRVRVESAVSYVSPEQCAGCGLCVETCPFGALALDDLAGAVRVNPSLCKSCGACANICPCNAIRVQHFKPEQILAQVDGLLFPN